ncbi:hypothetical protein A33M_0083 [Rhodovulum sp. PH10]|uniref:hypothetical protein n=1 Tax=Rhodovulum sp. PH10 TaxID=1187851 RepID=UPI00027C1DA2|nr:hypothetical protein [Rhodovulum sp. PH10]EJW13226.1 hypothetical protein A33M_0083 [Rhodovulum sp. PH10]
MSSRLIVTGDVFRPFRRANGWESATWKNIRWLDGIVGTAARLAGWEVSTVAWDEGLPDGHGFFDTPAFYDLLGLPVSIESWAQVITRPSLPAEIEAAIATLLDADLVVGSEMPDHLLRILDAAGTAVVDVVAHPVRFLDDLVMALRTNRADIHARLLRHAFDLDAAVMQAGWIRSKVAWMAPPLPLVPGTALVLGQVADHADTIRDLALASAMVLFKPHPYDRPDSATQRMMRGLGAVRWTDTNLYHLLARPEIETVCAINSSGLDEAEFFGKRVIRLAPPLHVHGDAPPPAAGGFGEAVPQDDAWCDPSFWRALRTGDDEDRPLLAPRANRLRRSLNADWGFCAIDRILA